MKFNPRLQSRCCNVVDVSVYNVFQRPRPFLFALALPLCNLASPNQERNAPNGWIEHYRETGRGGGSLIYFGPQSDVQERSETVDLEQHSCGKAMTPPKCDSHNAARNGNCVALVAELYDDFDVTINGSPRQICYQSDSDKNSFCCVSWHDKITGLRKQGLAPYAQCE
ncbi:hypothetical protein CNMCM5878_003417 [Aspergillus fumigatiaffinis]|nr:hypothetical protein CNMCM5878_003417 [Aspergillus fumigatiaffinis]